ncbi:MAG: 5'-nucleotidase/apyrase family protein [Fimbriimonadaceae bacterium]|nr:5'-nucleotidase C-terminal domain-containing protein [Chthonomonadaceae bacterium]MCO5296226.1 5'-nucleotidase/apyrase family protein [Fimbriimonadaceae bacterium]
MRRLASLLISLVAALAFGQSYTLTVLHTDDLHGHIEPVKVGKGMYGGYAKHVTLLMRFAATEPNPVVLSGGDTFQGTMYFKVYEGLADAFFMNLMGYRAMAVGNHEFDLGPKPLGVFARNVQFPMLAANLDVSGDPDLKDVIKRSVVIVVGGQRIGLVGAVTPQLPDVSSPGPTVKMLELMSNVQKEVDQFSAQGINKVILLSHLGYELEKKVAATVRGVDVIVGGHSHSLLGTFANPDFPASEGPYPTVVQNPGGNKTLLVASWEWGKVLGHLQVDFNAKGAVTAWRGAPVVVDASIPDDPFALSALDAFRMPILAASRKVVGKSDAGVPNEEGRLRESAMGDLIADATLEACAASNPDFAVVNSGGVRAPLPSGTITYDKLVEVQPFANTLIVMELTGKEIKAALEYGLSGLEEKEGRFLQVSRGFHYAFDASKPVGSRLLSASLKGQPVEDGRTYRVAVNQYIANGGDGFEVLKAAPGMRWNLGLVDIDALEAYVAKYPLPSKPEGRIDGSG